VTAGPVTRHVLPGLRPEPLASYLAGLGLIRALGEQVDPALTAAWTPEGLALRTTVKDPAAWLAGDFVPTPVLSPWNNGSGFGAKDKEPKRILSALISHPSARLRPLQDAITVAQAITEAASAAGWLADGKDEGKRRIILEFRNRCPESALPWIDAAVVLGADDTFFPPLLGTGGNDGRLDFSTNFHQRLVELLNPADKARARSLALAGDLLAGTQSGPLTAAAVGQFDPAAAGGPGSSQFGAAESLVNPWGYVLLVEGSLMFAASTVRRGQHDARRAAIPFTVRESPDGSASGADGEKSRGEVWVPVWRRGFTLAEIGQLFGEARASWRGRPARQAVEFYAATGTHGVARGIDEFVRYGLHQRNGLAFAAVPVDHVHVRSRPAVSLAAKVEDWVAQVRRTNPAAGIARAVRQFDRAYLEFARGGDPLWLTRLLAAVTTLELAVGRSGSTREKVPVRHRLPSASPFLAELAQAECAELRVAVGLASCATRPGTDPDRSPARTMREILLPVSPRRDGRSWTKDWQDAPMVAGFGVRPLQQVLAGVLAWRSRTAADERGQQEPGDAPAFRGIPTFRLGITVPAADLHALAGRRLDEGALELWLRACLALDWFRAHRDWKAVPAAIPVPVLGLLHPLARGLASDVGEQDPAAAGRGSSGPLLAMRPDWAARLAAGQVTRVHEEAAVRLRQAGWAAAPAVPGAAGADGTRIAAALVPRARDWDAELKKLAIRTDSSQNEERHGGDRAAEAGQPDGAAPPA
jgi:CRISPR-associated protein Csx17